MNTPLLIAERIPRGMTRLAREYYTFYDAHPHQGRPLLVSSLR